MGVAAAWLCLDLACAEREGGPRVSRHAWPARAIGRAAHRFNPDAPRVASLMVDPAFSGIAQEGACCGSRRATSRSRDERGRGAGLPSSLWRVVLSGGPRLRLAPACSAAPGERSSRDSVLSPLMTATAPDGALESVYPWMTRNALPRVHPWMTVHRPVSAASRRHRPAGFVLGRVVERRSCQPRVHTFRRTVRGRGCHQRGQDRVT